MKNINVSISRTFPLVRSYIWEDSFREVIFDNMSSLFRPRGSVFLGIGICGYKNRLIT